MWNLFYLYNNFEPFEVLLQLFLYDPFTFSCLHLTLKIMCKQDKYTMDPGSQIDRSNQKIILSKKWFFKKIIKNQ